MAKSKPLGAARIGDPYIGVVPGMTAEEAHDVLAYAKDQFNEWATFTIVDRRDGFATDKPGYGIDYVTKTVFHRGQSTEVNAYLRGFLAGIRKYKRNLEP